MNAIVGLVVIALLVVNAMSWYYYAKVRQAGASILATLFLIVAGTVVPFLPLVGLVTFARRRRGYLATYGTPRY
jgi:hypothetical protein